MEQVNPTLSFEIFVRVIDNHGDAGVTLRLARRLSELGHRCRLWIDDPELLLRMSPQMPKGVTWLAWPLQAEHTPAVTGDVWIEAFGCALPDWVQSQWNVHSNRFKSTKNWINLEYFTTEDFATRCHGLPSPVLQGPSQGATKWFYYPGWTAGLGGVVPRTKAMDSDDSAPSAQPLKSPIKRPSALLFCYEPPALGALCQHWKEQVHMRVAAGRPQQAWHAQCPNTKAEFLNWTDQLTFDRLLAESDFNLVRGEDSILTAMSVDQPYLWQIYPQDDEAHADKLNAFLDTLNAPKSVVIAHEIWNGLRPLNNNPAQAFLPLPHTSQWAEWAEFAHFSAQQLRQAPDLAQELVDFVMSGKI